MKVQYNKDQDILMIQLIKRKIDDAYETENMIVHVAKDREPVLLEIFNGQEFLKSAARNLPKNVKQEIMDAPSGIL